MTASVILDFNTVAIADKFGNLSVVSVCLFLHVDGRGYIVHTQIRLPPDTSDEVDEDPTGTRTIWDRGWLSGAAQKVLSTYHTVTPHGTWVHGDIV